MFNVDKKLAEMAEGAAKNWLAGLDLDKNGVPDIVQHIDVFGKLVGFCAVLLKRFNARDWERILTLLNAEAGQKFSADEIRFAAALLDQSGPALEAVAKGSQQVEEKLAIGLMKSAKKK